jgi:hypothetical protein
MLITPDVDFTSTSERVVSQLRIPTHHNSDVMESKSSKDILMSKDGAATFERDEESSAMQRGGLTKMATKPGAFGSTSLCDYPSTAIHSDTTPDQHVELRQRARCAASVNGRQVEEKAHVPSRDRVPTERVAPTVPHAAPRRGTRVPQPVRMLSICYNVVLYCLYTLCRMLDVMCNMLHARCDKQYG